MCAVLSFLHTKKVFSLNFMHTCIRKYTSYYSDRKITVQYPLHVLPVTEITGQEIHSQQSTGMHTTNLHKKY